MRPTHVALVLLPAAGLVWFATARLQRGDVSPLSSGVSRAVTTRVSGELAPPAPHASRAIDAAAATSAFEPRVARCTTRSGAPVARARLHARVAGRTKSLGHTDERGELSFGSVAEPVDALVAVADGFASTEVRVASSARDIGVVLVPEGRVAGSVRLASGASAGPGVAVFACPRDVADEAALASRARCGDPAACITETRDDGSFEIGALEPDVAYWITAGGAGYVLEAPHGALRAHREVRPGDLAIDLVVQRVLATRVRIVDARTGERARVSSGLWGHAQRASCDDRSVRQIVVGGAETTLAGLERAIDDDAAETLLAFVARDDRDELESLRFQVELPGYEPVDATLRAYPLRPGVERTDVVAVPIASGFGEIVVRFDAALAGAGSPREGAWPDALLHLDDGRGHAFSWAVPSFAERETRLAGIPFGTYEWSFEAQAGAFVHPGAGEARKRVTVGPSAAYVDVPIARLGTLRVDVVRANGDVARGAVQLRLARASGAGALSLVNLRDCPCFVRGLAAGDYSLATTSPVMLSPFTLGAERVVVASGEVAPFTLRLP